LRQDINRQFKIIMWTMGIWFTILSAITVLFKFFI